MVTIELDLTTIMVAAISSLVSIAGSALVTWYFSRRHYTRTLRRTPVTENDIILRDNENGFRFMVVLCVLAFIVIMTFIIVCPAPPERTQEDSTTDQEPIPRSLSDGGHSFRPEREASVPKVSDRLSPAQWLGFVVALEGRRCQDLHPNGLDWES